MFLRRLTSTAFAALMLTGFAAASARAQTQTQHHTRSGHHARAQHHAQTGHHARAQHHAGRTRHTAHDRGPTSSDRGAADRLNAQSLEQARAGAGAGGTGR